MDETKQMINFLKNAGFMKDIKNFLRERNLLTAFKRFQKIKRSKRLKIDVDGTVLDVTIYKKGDKTIVADSLRLKTLATSKKYNTKTIIGQLKKREKVTSKVIKAGLTRTGIKIKTKIKTPKIKIKEIKRTLLSDKSGIILIERQTPLRSRLGKLWINVTFIDKKDNKKIVEAGSATQRFLHKEDNRQKAFNEAMKGAFSQINFSPKEIIINWVHYAYYEQDKNI